MPPVMKILYGPPGTGKTYRAIREAVQVIDGAVDPETVTDRFRQLVLTGRIFPVTFHPSYSYEDFVEGFRPRPGRDGSIVYEIVDGPCAFSKFCRGFSLNFVASGAGVWGYGAPAPALRTSSSLWWRVR